MSYLEEFRTLISNRDFLKFIQLWEEYCTCDAVDVDELMQILRGVKNSELAKPFGQVVETALLLWQTVEDKKDSYELLKLILDIETTNTPNLAETALQALKQKYPSDPHSEERLRLVGLRSKDNFQGALANYDLLAHMKKGNFVFHTGGWGTGEILDVSPVREQLSIEFENVAGRKDINFSNCFKTLLPLDNDNFLARRFSNPDLLEKEARENPVEIVKIFLRDMGPRTAAEIKDEMCELVIPEDDWTKWWQWARGKIKKDPMIESPNALKEPFRLRKAEISHGERMQKAIHASGSLMEILQKSYNLVRDMPAVLKNEDVKGPMKHKLLELFATKELPLEQELQLAIFLDNSFDYREPGRTVEELIKKTENIDQTINDIEILAFKKRVLTAIQEHRPDWIARFLALLFIIPQSALRDYIFKELNQGEGKQQLRKKIEELLHKPTINPDLFVWYFQKLTSKEGDEELPFQNQEGLCQFFESFLILYAAIESKPEYRELTKKMYNMLSGKRYALVRQLIQGTSIEFINEFLLLVSKCQTFTDHDVKILRSLAEVVHPSLASGKINKDHALLDGRIVWTTEEGYLTTQDKIRHIGTVEIVENAREIEAARALGDLRENSEYKFALERRSRLQGQLKTLSDQLNRARIIAPEDIHQEKIGVGNVVTLENPRGEKSDYTILGPWDANPDKGILSFQSKLAQSMIGAKKGEKINFKDEDFTVVAIKSYLDV